MPFHDMAQLLGRAFMCENRFRLCGVCILGSKSVVCAAQSFAFEWGRLRLRANSFGSFRPVLGRAEKKPLRDDEDVPYKQPHGSLSSRLFAFLVVPRNPLENEHGPYGEGRRLSGGGWRVARFHAV